MKRFFLFAITITAFLASYAQTDADATDNRLKKDVRPKFKNVQDGSIRTDFIVLKNAGATPVKNQAMTGTCWCFSTTSLIESQCLKNNLGDLDLSEMFSVRNTYLGKAKNYILRQGHTQFGEGGLGHDLINSIAKYGAVSESAYSGLKNGNTQHNHVKLVKELKIYLDSILTIVPLPDNWMEGYEKKMNAELGVPPAKFNYKGKEYTPKTFAAEVVKFNPEDYVYITSFTHHPYYEPFILEVPDNFSSGAYYNVPLNEMIQLTKDALNNGYSILWDADVSNDGFLQQLGAAVNFANLPPEQKSKAGLATGEAKEGKWDAAIRQKLFENLTTQDDHLMHITGLEKSKTGNPYFLVKNSWGDMGPDHGYINVSEAYFAINTISLVIPKAALSKLMLEKLKIK